MTEAAAEMVNSQPVDLENHPEFFQIRGQIYTLISLRVINPDTHHFFMTLHKEIGRAPDFYRHAPVVIDVGPIAEQKPFNLAEFGRRLRQLSLVPVGIQNGNEAWNAMAINAGLGLFPAGRPAAGGKREPANGQGKAEDAGSQSQASQAQPERAASPALSPTYISPAMAGPPRQAGRAPAKIITEPVRAGQQVYAKNADLVALAQVQPGAELMADGNIHIYGSLRGRAHAGVGGDAGAQIFCRSMEAQLISIGGIYLVNEEIEQQFLGQPVQIGCQNETIVMKRLP